MSCITSRWWAHIKGSHKTRNVKWDPMMWAHPQYSLILQIMLQLELSEDLTIAPLQRYLRKDKLVTENRRQKKEEIKGGISSSIAVYTIHCICSSCLYCFNFLRLAVLEEKCYENFKCLKTGEKEKWRNKGTNKQQQPDSGINHTSAHCPCVYQVSTF